MGEQGFITMKELARRNGVSYSWVKQLAREGKIVSAQAVPGGKRLIPVDAFERMMSHSTEYSATDSNQSDPD